MRREGDAEGDLQQQQQHLVVVAVDSPPAEVGEEPVPAWELWQVPHEAVYYKTDFRTPRSPAEASLSMMPH